MFSFVYFFFKNRVTVFANIETKLPHR